MANWPIRTFVSGWKQEFQQHPAIDGLAVTFEPYVYDPVVELYQSDHYQQADGTFANLDGASYDYSVAPSDDPKAPKTAWYHQPLEKGADVAGTLSGDGCG